MRHIMHAIGVVVAVCVAGSLLIDEGEVVTLVTEDAAGQHETQLWVVEIGGAQYLRASSPRVAWLARLREQPRVELLRGEGPEAERHAYIASVATGDADLSARIDRAMADKHGFAERVWAALTSQRGGVVPIRLEPLATAPAEIGRYPGGSDAGTGAARATAGGPS